MLGRDLSRPAFDQGRGLGANAIEARHAALAVMDRRVGKGEMAFLGDTGAIKHQADIVHLHRAPGEHPVEQGRQIVLRLAPDLIQRVPS